MKASQMNKLISQLNSTLGFVHFGVVGLDRQKATDILEKWFDWY